MATDNLDIGADFAGVDDLAYSLVTVSGRRALGEAIARRWLTLRGSLAYAPDYGQGLATQLLSDLDPSLAGKLEQEALKDERVERIEVRVAFVQDELRIVARVEDAAGPFSLTVAYDGLKTALTLSEEG